jgi:hypothetical protein
MLNTNGEYNDDDNIIKQINITEDNIIKQITITDNYIKTNKSNKNKTNKIIVNEKEIKLRVETKTWGLNEEQLIHKCQLDSLHNLLVCSSTKYDTKIVSHIKSKLCSYKHQDITKKKLNDTAFVSFNEVIKMLVDCGLKCFYCSQNVFILYERVREQTQWSLDRINNDLGHNTGNLVIACLECNLKRRRTNKDAFMFTKNMVIIKMK